MLDQDRDHGYVDRKKPGCGDQERVSDAESFDLGLQTPLVHRGSL